MSSKHININKSTLLHLAVCSVFCLLSACQGNPPVAADDGKELVSVKLPGNFEGSFTHGSHAVYTDTVNLHDGHKVPTIKSMTPAEDEFASIATIRIPGEYLGKRLRYTAWMKTDSAVWAGLWMRVDAKDPNAKSLAFDNMNNRPVKGTTGWARYEIVLDVPNDAANVVYGVLLHDKGQLWLDSVHVEIVDTTMARTDK